MGREPFILVAFQNSAAAEKLVAKIATKGKWHAVPAHGYLNFIYMARSLQPEIILTSVEWPGYREGDDFRKFLKEVCPDSRLLLASPKEIGVVEEINATTIYNLLTDKADAILVKLSREMGMLEKSLRPQGATVRYGEKWIDMAAERHQNSTERCADRWLSGE